MCEWRGVRVHNVNYFSLSGGGHVEHDRPRSFNDTLAISTAPFFLNTILAAVFYTLAYFIYNGSTLFLSGAGKQFLLYGVFVAVWLGISTGSHAIPSTTDAKNVWREAKKRWRSSLLAFLSLPLVVFLYVANLLQFLWFDVLYSLAIGFVVLLVFAGI
ncbi:MAG: DUF3267 domain-containing protein [Halobacteriaceae archaeon]